MGNERDVTTRRMRAARPWLSIEEGGVRAREVDTGLLLPEQVFAVMLLWDAGETGAGAWIGWLTTVNHRALCFCAADLHEGGFRDWLEQLPSWEPARLSKAIEVPGLHLIWRRHSD